MAITDPLMLPEDVILLPVAELPEQVRARFTYDEGDFAMTRPRSRIPSKVVDAQAANLIARFQKPITIVQAVFDYSRSVQADSEETLTEAFPLLRELFLSRLLVSAVSAASEAVTTKHNGHAADYAVIRSLQDLEDTELHQIRYDGRVAVLKQVRPDVNPMARHMLAREAEILKQVGGTVSPALLKTGLAEEHPYLIMDWYPGVEASLAAAEIRRQNNKEGQRKLLELNCKILDAYSQLHEAGVVHADVHPRNVLVDRHATVKLIDFGLAHRPGSDDRNGYVMRGGIGFFFEPEYASALLNSASAPPSYGGEQYSLAALIYLLFTGTYYLDFTLERESLLRQIVEDDPVPLDLRGVHDWPAVERVLRRALHKQPKARFDSVAEFAAELRAAVIADWPGKHQGPPGLRKASAADQILEKVRSQLHPANTLFRSGLPQAPTCSVKMGAAGIAYFLYRLAVIQGSAELLSQADLWAAKSLRDSRTENAFYSSDLDLAPDTIGRISLFHTASGVHCVRDLIGHALGDLTSQQTAIAAFIWASSQHCADLDLTVGRSSTLLGCSLLLDTINTHQSFDAGPLVALGQQTLTGIWEMLDEFAPIQECNQIRYLGIAHGWAGFLYATLLWNRSAGAALPGQAQERLGQLAALAEPIGRGARWKWALSPDLNRGGYQYMPGWCNGSSGYVHLWTLAHEVFGEDRYLDLAEQAAWNTWEEPGGIDNLCCGLAGRSYGLLNLFRYTGEKTWLERARVLAERAATATSKSDLPAYSLYKGEIGVALLAADLTRPEQSCVPFFEREGWHI
jgi:serine/threonine-protein kinase